jgi:putative transposase
MTVPDRPTNAQRQREGAYFRDPVRALARKRIFELIHRKRACEPPSEPGEALVDAHIGSKSWHTRGYLPHYDKPGTMQMLTFRLADAMPADRRHEWELFLKIEDGRVQRTKLEAYLDLGYGECLLRKSSLASALENVLLKFDGERYRIAAWVIMPNHVHVLVELWTMPLGQLVKGWKGPGARLINQMTGRNGQLWQDDYWDRFIRDEDHFRTALKYIESNPVKAGLAKLAADWTWSSANPKWQWVGVDRFRKSHLPGASWKQCHDGPPSWLALDHMDEVQSRTKGT